MRPMQQIFLNLALRRAAHGTGSQPTFLQERTTMLPIPDIAGILGSIPWTLVGGLATRAYMPERMTLDVDILIRAQDEGAVRDAFIAAGYHVTGVLSIGGFSVQVSQQPPIDVLLAEETWLIKALLNPNHDDVGNPVLPRPALIMMKLHAGRTQDLADIQRMLASTDTNERATIRADLAHQNPDLAEEFDALVQLADWEFGTTN